MKPENLNIKTLAESAIAANENLTGVEAKKVSIIVFEVFGEIRQQLKNTEEGSLRVGGLGIFKVRVIEAKQGKNMGQIVKKVVFIPNSER